jgi:hypothetical protein
MIKTLKCAGLALSLVVSISATTARADQANDNTFVTFSEPVEVAGHILPAGKYTFTLADSLTDRHIVQIFNDNGRLIATVMAVPDYRLKPTDESVIKFAEVPGGSVEAVRAWFYPGNTVGQEFVYPKPRAAQLAKAAHAPVPAIAADAIDADALRTAPIVAITPDEKESPVAAVIRTTPVAEIATVGTLASKPTAAIGTTGTTPVPKAARQLPKTASSLPLIVLCGLVSGGLGVCLILFGKRRRPLTV